MHCQCRTDERSLVILAPGLDRYPEFELMAERDDWTVHPALGAIRVEVGSASRWSGIAQVANFLRTVLDAGRFGALRAAWVRAGAPLEEQLVTLLHCGPLAEMVSVDSSPLPAMMRDNRIESWFQPIFWAGTLELWGYECLMRGRAEDGALVPPVTLLEWARQEHLTFMLDRHTRELHLGNAGRKGIPSDCHLLVNFLPTAIYKPEFCLRTTVRAAALAGLDPDHVVFEMVETEQVDREHLRNLLAYYRATGFKVALDDVGSGYSGLAMMADLNPDLIKIDRELVSRSVDSPFHREVCASLVKLGQDNGQMVLAEGVEREEEWRVMSGLGVNLLQGYLFGRPQPELVTHSLVQPSLQPALATPA